MLKLKLTSKDLTFLRGIKISDPHDLPVEPCEPSLADDVDITKQAIDHIKLVAELDHWRVMARRFRRQALVSQRLLFIACLMCLIMCAWVTLRK